MSTRIDLANQQRGPACLAGDALVAYLYDECTFEERQRIEGHLTSCGACAAEVEGLGGTRVQLSSWTPPDAALGFRISAATAPAVNAAHLIRPLSLPCACRGGASRCRRGLRP